MIREKRHLWCEVDTERLIALHSSGACVGDIPGIMGFSRGSITVRISKLIEAGRLVSRRDPRYGRKTNSNRHYKKPVARLAAVPIKTHVYSTFISPPTRAQLMAGR